VTAKKGGRRKGKSPGAKKGGEKNAVPEHLRRTRDTFLREDSERQKRGKSSTEEKREKKPIMSIAALIGAELSKKNQKKGYRRNGNAGKRRGAFSSQPTKTSRRRASKGGSRRTTSTSSRGKVKCTWLGERPLGSRANYEHEQALLPEIFRKPLLARKVNSIGGEPKPRLQ